MQVYWFSSFTNKYEKLEYRIYNRPYSFYTFKNMFVLPHIDGWFSIKKYNCSIVPVYIERIKNYHFKLYFKKPLKFEDNLTHLEITSELNKILEKMILKNPDQWIWTHDRWK